MRLWTEANLPPLAHAALVTKCTTRAQQSDLIRYEILQREGGVYLDTDFECLRSIEPLIAGASAFAVYQRDRETHDAIAQGIFGVVPGHPLMAEVLERAQARDPRTNLWAFGPPIFTAAVRAVGGVVLLPRPLFYPYLWTEPHRRGERFPDAYAVHHWASQWTDSYAPIT
jgi:mannosyltransferase OCH1-like enzyme